MKVTTAEQSQAHVVLSRTDVICLYNVLVAAQNGPLEIVGPQPFIRGLCNQVRELAREMGHNVEDA